MFWLHSKSSLLVLLPVVIACGRRIGTDGTDSVEEEAYSFSIAARTKSSEGITLDSLIEKGFDVYAFISSDTERLFSDKAEYDISCGLFHTVSSHIHPPGQKLDFFACHPSPDELTADGKGRAYLTFSHSRKLPDIIAAQEMATICGPQEPVSLYFRHLMSRIRISLRSGSGQSDITVTRLAMTIPSRASCLVPDRKWESLEAEEMELAADTLSLAEGRTVELDELYAMPAGISVFAIWECRRDEILTSVDSGTVDIPAQSGKISSITLLFPDRGSQELVCNSEIVDWEDKEVSVSL